MSEFTDSFGWWITGLADGEACFFASIVQREGRVGKSRHGMTLDARFQLTLRYDDVDTVRMVHDYFGCGKMRKKPGKGRNCPQSELKVYKTDDLLNVIVPHFEKYPLKSKKKKDFETWREMLVFYDANLRGTRGWMCKSPEKVVMLTQLCDKIRSDRGFPGEGQEAI